MCSRGARKRQPGSGRLAAIVTPESFGAALVPCQHARNHEQQVREAVEVLRDLGTDFLGTRERTHAPLGAPRDAARKVAVGRGGSTARENELLERRKSVIEAIERALQAHNLLGRDGEVTGNAQLPAHVEKLVL